MSALLPAVAAPKASKKTRLAEQIAAAVGAGRHVAVETVDFSDPNRPKTCLEVDFPIIPLNLIAAPEMSSGSAKKPIYAWQKWWARRSSAVFRGLLIAAVTKAPEDESKAAKSVWDFFYANHQVKGALRHLKVADPFMGGGTTVIEGSRLGMQMWGCDLNPVAWLIVKNGMSDVDGEEVRRLLSDIEAEVKPMVMPYFACDGPGGERGRWFRRGATAGADEGGEGRETWDELPTDFDVFAVPWAERRALRYEGPEIIYTFWAKHGPCQRAGCGHRTPIMSTPVVAIKTLTVSAWADRDCPDCGTRYDVERHAARMAPDAPLTIAPDEGPFAVMDAAGEYRCPGCGRRHADPRAAREGQSANLGKAKNKKVILTLLLHPQWLDGCPGRDAEGRQYGGSVTDAPAATARWNQARAAKLRLLEVRGTLPEEVTCPETKVTFHTDVRGGTMPKKSTFACRACGTLNDVLDAVKASGRTGPVAAYVVQGYSGLRDQAGVPYGGRFFAAVLNAERHTEIENEWTARKEVDLKGCWPESELPYGFMTHHLQGGVPNHGFTHWWKLFNPHQLLVLGQICNAFRKHTLDYSDSARCAAVGVWHRYLQHDNMLCFWDEQQDCLAPSLANSNFHPKNNLVQNNPFHSFGRGNWESSVETCLEAIEWKTNPWELVTTASLQSFNLKGKTFKVPCSDRVEPAESRLICSSATDCSWIEGSSVDLVITDPPFGGLLHYAELSDFFYVWLRLALKDRYPDLFGPEYTPKTLEAVANRARQPDDPDAFYQRILTECWRESYRVLKAGGLLAFTFHHSEDEPWVGVLESLFDAGFYLEATYPIRSDDTKGEGEFGSKQIEYDIIHVCRKRTAAPAPISWARLRRQIVEEVRRLRRLLEQHQAAGLPAADLQVIKRGKALEFFSRHYGQVFVEQGREFTIREALLSINQLLDEETGGSTGIEPPPVRGEAYTRQFYRIFQGKTEVPRNEMMNWLRGTGIAPNDFEARGWCKEKSKVFGLVSPVEWARAWKGASRRDMARDFDQAMFLLGGCFEGSGVRVTDTLNSPVFAPHPATADWLDWLSRHGGSPEMRAGAGRARTIYRDWLSRNQGKEQEQLALFDLAAA